MHSSTKQSSSIHIDDILNENNRGIEYLSKAQFGAAKKAFRSAIVQLRAFYQQQQRNEDYSQFLSLIIEPRTIPLSPKNTKSSETSSTSTQHYIYRNALVASIDYNAEEQQQHKKQDFMCTDLTAMIIFNMCLVHHCSAEGYESQADKTRVLRLYKKAFEALKKDSMHHDTIALGILNNMGATFHDLGKYPQAQHCFRALKIAVSNSTNVQTLNREQRNGLILNVLCFEQPTTAIAA